MVHRRIRVGSIHENIIKVDSSGVCCSRGIGTNGTSIRGVCISMHTTRRSSSNPNSMLIWRLNLFSFVGVDMSILSWRW